MIAERRYNEIEICNFLWYSYKDLINTFPESEHNTSSYNCNILIFNCQHLFYKRSVEYGFPISTRTKTS